MALNVSRAKAKGIVKAARSTNNCAMALCDDPIPPVKEQLRREILAVVGRWPQEVGAYLLGLDQPRMSDLERGRIDRFSVTKLIRLLATLDRRVDVRVTNVATKPLRPFAPRPKVP